MLVPNEKNQAMTDEFEHIAIRAFNPGFMVGDIMPNSFRWEDGEICEDEELDGACGFRVRKGDDIDEAVEYVRNVYAFDGRVVYMIGGDYMQFGEDDEEIIIRNARVVKVFG